MITWTPNRRIPSWGYNQAVVLPGCMMTTEDLPYFEAFLKNEFGTKHPSISVGCVTVTYDDRGYHDPEHEEGRIDYVFLVHDEDVSNPTFSESRRKYKMEWLEDLLNNDPPIYPHDFCSAYPMLW